MDILLRLICHCLKEDFVIASVQLESDLFSVINESLQSFLISFQQIKHAVKEDVILQKSY